MCPRPRLCRRIRFNPDITYFKPQGVPMREILELQLDHDELEAMRLKNIKKFDQTTAAEKMNVSQSTFQRILASAYEKVTQALVEGNAIKIVKK